MRRPSRTSAALSETAVAQTLRVEPGLRLHPYWETQSPYQALQVALSTNRRRWFRLRSGRKPDLVWRFRQSDRSDHVARSKAGQTRKKACARGSRRVEQQRHHENSPRGTVHYAGASNRSRPKIEPDRKARTEPRIPPREDISSARLLSGIDCSYARQASENVIESS